MTSPIDKYYQQYGHYIDAAAGAMNDKRINFWFRACRLKPYTTLTPKGPSETQFKRHWVDESGGAVRLTRVGPVAMRVAIILADATIDRKLIKSTDLYQLINLLDLINITKCVMLVVAHDERNVPVYILTSLGQDNFFRTRIFKNGIWTTSSPLIMGIDLLNKFSKHYADKQTVWINSNNKTILPVTTDACWISRWPLDNVLKDTVRTLAPQLYSQLRLYII